MTAKKPTEPVAEEAAEPPVRDSGPGRGPGGTGRFSRSSGTRPRRAEAQRDEYLRDLQRLAADFDNFRKRVARDQEALVARAHERLMKELCPCSTTSSGRSRGGGAAACPRQRTEWRSRGKGGSLGFDGTSVSKRSSTRCVSSASARQSLEREGLVEIEANSAFDPHIHEALLAQPVEGREHGEVLEVVQKGYRLGDRVLRPARVVVAE